MIVRFVHRDPVDPGTQATLLAERTNVSKDLQEHILYYVGGIALVIQKPKNHSKDGLLKAGNQLFIGFFDAGTKSAQDSCIFLRQTTLSARQDRQAARVSKQRLTHG